MFRIGQEIIRFEELRPSGRGPDGVERFGSPAKGYIGRLALVIGRDTTGNAFPVPERGVHCGRERGDILFPEDGYVSGLHCRIARANDGRVYLTDVGSSNGTFIRLRTEQPPERRRHPADGSAAVPRRLLSRARPMSAPRTIRVVAAVIEQRPAT